MGYYIVAFFSIMIFYFLFKLVKERQINNCKNDLRKLKRKINKRIKAYSELGPITEEEKVSYWKDFHSTSSDAISAQTTLSIIRKYFGIPGAMFAIGGAFVSFFYYNISLKFNPTLELINIIEQSELGLNKVALDKLESLTSRVSKFSDASLAMSSISQILLTILFFVDIFSIESHRLIEEFEGIKEEIEDLLDDS